MRSCFSAYADAVVEEIQYQHKKALQELDAGKEHASDEEAIMKLLEDAGSSKEFFETLYKYRNVAEKSDILLKYLSTFPETMNLYFHYC